MLQIAGNLKFNAKVNRPANTKEKAITGLKIIC